MLMQSGYYYPFDYPIPYYRYLCRHMDSHVSNYHVDFLVKGGAAEPYRVVTCRCGASDMLRRRMGVERDGGGWLRRKVYNYKNFARYDHSRRLYNHFAASVNRSGV